MKRIYNLRVHEPQTHLKVCRPKFRADQPTPDVVSLRSFYPGIRDQGQQGSCTGHMGRSLFGTTHNIEHGQALDFSPRFVYWNERVDDGDTDQDAGSSITECLTTICAKGICLEASCPYTDSDFTTPPVDAAFSEGLQYLGLEQQQVIQSPEDIQGLLAQQKVIGIGIAVYQSFESDEVAKTGIVPMPLVDVEGLEGWHAVTVIGYDRNKKMYECANSWGTVWGDAGFFWLPLDYVHNPTICSDIRVLIKAE